MPSIRRFGPLPKPISPEEAAEEAVIHERGTNDPRITAEGTIAYLITLDDGFSIIYPGTVAATLRITKGPPCNAWAAWT